LEVRLGLADQIKDSLNDILPLIILD
ncbi:MAG: hypothetical protein ACI9O5_002564, partial [Algoriphagus sp.]